MVCLHYDLGGTCVVPTLSRREHINVRKLLQTPKKEHAKPAPALPKAAEPTKAAKVDAAKPVPAPALKEVRSCVLPMSEPILLHSAAGATIFNAVPPPTARALVRMVLDLGFQTWCTSGRIAPVYNPALLLLQTQARSSKRHGLPLFLVELLLNAAIIAGLYGVVTGYNAVSSVASAITNWLQRQTERLAPPAEQR